MADRVEGSGAVSIEYGSPVVVGTPETHDGDEVSPSGGAMVLDGSRFGGGLASHENFALRFLSRFHSFAGNSASIILQ